MAIALNVIEKTNILTINEIAEHYGLTVTTAVIMESELRKVLFDVINKPPINLCDSHEKRHSHANILLTESC